MYKIYEQFKDYKLCKQKKVQSFSQLPFQDNVIVFYQISLLPFQVYLSQNRAKIVEQV